MQQPVVGSAARLKFQCAEGVGDVFQGIHEAVRIVIGGVDNPLALGDGVLHKLDAVGNEVEHVVVLILVVHPHPAAQAFSKKKHFRSPMFMLIAR